MYQTKYTKFNNCWNLTNIRYFNLLYEFTLLRGSTGFFWVCIMIICISVY